MLTLEPMASFLILPNIGPAELFLILLILLLLFGANRLAGLGSSLGRMIRDFRKEARRLEEDLNEEPSSKQAQKE